LTNVGRILTGEVQGATRYGDFAEIRVDDIVIAQ
jgi:predicted RNA-binding protein with RPS1 domain